jgi:predicted nucleic acid-binding protein
VTHPAVLANPLSASQAWSFIDAIRASPSFRVLSETDRHAEFASITIGEIPSLAGNVLHDLHTAIVMRENGVRRVFTRDTDFHRFRFLEVIDPLEPAALEAP